MPFRNGNEVWNATKWTDDMIEYLKQNFHSSTNRHLADTLHVGLTVLRNKTRELGLKKYVIEYWNEEMIQYLKENYQTKGDVEIMEFFKKNFPKNKGWKRSAIHKKRKQLGLFRTAEEADAIIKKNTSPGGSAYTIKSNSSSLNMHASWIAVTMARTDSELRSEILKHPEIIEAKRMLLQLKRAIKSVSNEKKKS